MQRMLPNLMRIAVQIVCLSLLCWLALLLFASQVFAQSYQGKEAPLGRRSWRTQPPNRLPGKPFTVGVLLRMPGPGTPT
jgi:hypothetical protein